MKNVVEVTHLEKVYGTFDAVQNVSFSLEENKIYGLLGRNGAGKTTLMNMISAQIFPTSGDLKVFGEAPYENNKVLSQICFIKEGQKYPDNFRVIDVLEVAKVIFPNWDADFANILMKDFNLPLKRRIKKLSRGMLSAVGIIIGLASRAPLTIFDEPYLGLDAVARGIFYDKLMEDYTEHPRTVVLSTHLIDEVSNLLEHILVIDNGKLIINQEAEDLRGMAFTVTGQVAKVEAFLAGKETVLREPFGGLLSATVIHANDSLDHKQAAANGLEISPVSLQQLIVHLTNGKSEQKGAIAK
ncbi:ABC transporter ATP-binding protein [Lederbergia lenta]|uniref:Putative ABC transporter ATP-binding protein n=1 Tax=Lederbergia lenta TaxID=1467 RepID=A0A2X4W4U3_LEDLE|nr:ABC transporter ATP-binding protein [Lederbergia lenta]MCM3112511.1 ABC transporter ATP-binding protein [Lederbergia lenta]MEC2323547.1 ABC transporter ATP-binding protein [Lederbergia lenta]SQI52610.1 putative ABC transporter ATP-binding protein [Lederbergia lenta]